MTAPGEKPPRILVEPHPVVVDERQQPPLEQAVRIPQGLGSGWLTSRAPTSARHRGERQRSAGRDAE